MIVNLTLVIPALNEEATIGQVVESMGSHPLVDEIIVVDNGSDDDTAIEAERAGAKVLAESIRGYGRAVKTGFIHANNEWVYKCDGDLRNSSPSWITKCVEAVESGDVLIKGAWESPEDDLPITRMVAKPALRILFPELLRFAVPLTGQFLVRKSAFDVERLADNYYLELDMLTKAHTQRMGMKEVWLGTLLHANRDGDHSEKMCYQILEGLFRASTVISRRISVVYGSSRRCCDLVWRLDCQISLFRRSCTATFPLR